MRAGWVVIVMGCAVPSGGLDGAPIDASPIDASSDARTDVSIDAMVDAGPDTPSDTGPDVLPDSCAAPIDEVCNGADDDCDMAIDEARPCTTGLMGACSDGMLMCASVPACQPIATPVDETCNAIDDDCDGLIDEEETACSTGIPGICTAGIDRCGGRCEPILAAFGEELCDNGLDDDCDGELDEGNCEECESRYRDGRAYLFCFDEITAFEARNECSAQFGMRLVAIEDAAEQDWIADQLNDIDDDEPVAWWISLYDTGGDRRGDHRWWPDDSGDPGLSYQHWISGEPNADEDDCVRIFENSDREWADNPCDVDYRFICEPVL